MNKIKSSALAKLTATLLLCVTALVFCASITGTARLSELGVYGGSYESARQSMLEELCYDRAAQAAWRVLEMGEDPAAVYARENFRFTIYESTGALVCGSYEGEPVQAQVSFEYAMESDWARPPVTAALEPTVTPAVTPEPTVTPRPTPTVTPEPTARILDATEDFVIYEQDGEIVARPSEEMPFDWQLRRYRVEGFVPAQLLFEDEISARIRLFDQAYAARYRLLAAAALSFGLGLLLFVFLCAAAGHRRGTEAVVPGVLERVPFDLLSLLAVVAVATPLALAGESFRYDPVRLMLCGLCILISGLSLLLWCLSLAVRLKLGTVLESCLCWRLLRDLWRGVKAFCRGALHLAGRLPMLRRDLLLIAAVWLGEIFLIFLFGIRLGSPFLWLLEHLALTALALYLLLAFKRLRQGAAAIAAGEEDYVVDSRYLVGELARHAGDLNHIRDGLSEAVGQRLKAERFRTELITNVSHDIKTPLTSIINYVDLLSREEPENERSREYLEVLRRQSGKLKKLIDDLIEASKASTGSLPVRPERLELGVLLDQTAGEYGERLAEKGLELVVSKPDRPLAVLADSRHMWRVVDNLMNNILHYAQPGTRVYLGLERQGERALMSFRNISHAALNISGDELMERFVRGDSSRGTEGSGLGLSIARSLTQLQGGELELSVDGDLFKVVLRFKALEEQR